MAVKINDENMRVRVKGKSAKGTKFKMKSVLTDKFKRVIIYMNAIWYLCGEKIKCQNFGLQDPRFDKNTNLVCMNPATKCCNCILNYNDKSMGHY